MAVPRRSPFLFSRSAAAFPPAPPSRLSSPLPLHFRRYRHNESDQFSPFDEPDVQPRTQNTPPKKPTLDPLNQTQHGLKKRKPALSVAEVKADLADTDWSLSNNLTGIQRRYVFRSFEEAAKYIALVRARCRGGTGHFPTCSNWSNRLFMRWTSYNSSCITRTDIQMARVCDRLYESAFAERASEPGHSSHKIPDDFEFTEDRQITYGEDSFYYANNHLDMWEWLPQIELYALKEHAYPLWGISHNRLVWTNIVWDGNSGEAKAIAREEKGRWRPGAPMRKVKGQRPYWLSNLADCVSQYWKPARWVEKLENPKKLPLRFSMARSNEELEEGKEKMEMEKEKREKRKERIEKKMGKNLQEYQSRPNRPPKTKHVRIFVD